MENIEISKKEGDQIVLQLKDGTQQSIQLPKSNAVAKEDEGEAPAAKDNDPDYKPAPRSSGRRKSELPSSATTVTSATATETVTITTTGGSGDPNKTPRVSNLTTVKLTSQSGSLSLSKANVIAATSSVNKSHIVSNASAMSKANLPAILKPASAPNTPLAGGLVLKSATAATSNRRQGGTNQMGKYIDNLPEVVDCINADNIDDKNMAKLPDRIMLVNSELPLHLSVDLDNAHKDYLFLQIISPVQSNRFICLLCKGIDVNFSTKEEKDILLHYQSLHELDVDIGQAKFSEETVFICLPKMVLSQLDGSQNSLSLNSACQYCESRLNDIPDMKNHYRQEHQKEVILMEQEEIMKMHHNFYCHKCKHSSADFDSHHKHMKENHQLKTYRCKSCVLVTQDESRLRTHYKAKHMLHTSGQNYSCFYCHGLLIGVERLLKHIQQAHMVQTGTDFSCISCMQQCGRGKDLLNHAERCSLAGIKPEQHNFHYVNPMPDPRPPAEGEVDCYFCSVRLESQEVYELHLHHEHMKWISKAASPVEKKEEEEEEGENGVGSSSTGSTTQKLLTINDVISEEDVERAQIKTYVGHWCRLCDQMIKVYPLYYLHMVNYHNNEKKFECIVTNCKQHFTDFEAFKNHIEVEDHSQKSVISHPDEVSVCTYCDIYFASEEALVNHLITDAHINKFTSSGHFHRTEPRNFKCKACHTFFGMKESYIHHLETEDHKYMCHYCGITTATPSARRAHVQNTHPERLSFCEECAEQHTDIMAHFVSHGFTFDCQKCVKKFYNRERLNAHMEVHLDAIQCNWPGCNRMIATRSMLVTHYRGHKSEHKCNICGQAFWNFSMLTSHQRSHNQVPRASTGSAAQKAAGKYAVSNYSNIRTSNQPVGALRRAPGSAAASLPANSHIQCGHCKEYFTAKELGMHNCRRGRASTSAAAMLNNGASGSKQSQQQLLYDMDVKTAAAMLNRPGTSKQAGMHHQQAARGRKPSPQKKMGVSVSQEDVDIALENSINEANADEDTQLIMILNQVTGELMEITAPKGMEVKDVIESLNFQQMEEAVAVQLVDDQGEQPQLQEVAEPPEEVVAVQHIANQDMLMQHHEQEGSMAVQHIEEQVMMVPHDEAVAVQQIEEQVMLMQQQQQQEEVTEQHTGEETVVSGDVPMQMDGEEGQQHVMILQEEEEEQVVGEGGEHQQEEIEQQQQQPTVEEMIAAAGAEAQVQEEEEGVQQNEDPNFNMSNILF